MGGASPYCLAYCDEAPKKVADKAVKNSGSPPFRASLATGWRVWSEPILLLEMAMAIS